MGEKSKTGLINFPSYSRSLILKVIIILQENNL